MSSAARSSLREEQKQVTRRRLLDAAELVFARRGYHGASVDEIARQAGATTGALYSSFKGKEDLFIALFERIVEGDLSDYAELFAASTSPDEAIRGVAGHWMRLLADRPHYFPLIVEFWSYAIREPRLREPLAAVFRRLSGASAGLIADGAQARGIAIGGDVAGRLGLLVTALGNGLALQKLLDPGAVEDDFYGEMLALIFRALQTLAEQDAGAARSNGERGGRR